MTRIDDTFARLNVQDKKAFVAYVMAGDPDFDTSLEIVRGLPAAGVDIIELGLPFTDPMADGPTIQLAGQRALEQGMTLERTLELARTFRETDNTTPIVLMGYYNPIYNRGVETFLNDAKAAGIDGLIVVDLPPEEDDELCIPAQNAGLNFIRLAGGVQHLIEHFFSLSVLLRFCKHLSFGQLLVNIVPQRRCLSRFALFLFRRVLSRRVCYQPQICGLISNDQHRNDRNRRKRGDHRVSEVLQQ